MQEKIKLGILFGGRSAEHEVSIQSAKNIVDALDRNKYEPVLVGLTKSGSWHLSDEVELAGIAASNGAFEPKEKAQSIKASIAKVLEIPMDVVFPILHGPFGEDGTVQGLLKLANIPFVGCGVLGSAVGMDKDVMKRLLRDAGLPIGKFIAITNVKTLSFDEALEKLGLPLFVKPANMGSSVGISKVHCQEDFVPALLKAFEYDTKVIVEEFIAAREIECSVLGKDKPKASVPGEIVANLDFYSYEAKYLDETGARLEVPAKLDPVTIKAVQELAVKVFKTLCCEGLGRVDFFLRPDKTLVVNEINTMPGFTKISMYPKLWEASGLGYSDLIDRLISLCLA